MNEKAAGRGTAALTPSSPSETLSLKSATMRNGTGRFSRASVKATRAAHSPPGSAPSVASARKRLPGCRTGCPAGDAGEKDAQPLVQRGGRLGQPGSVPPEVERRLDRPNAVHVRRLRPLPRGHEPPAAAAGEPAGAVPRLARPVRQPRAPHELALVAEQLVGGVHDEVAQRRERVIRAREHLLERRDAAVGGASGRERSSARGPGPGFGEGAVVGAGAGAGFGSGLAGAAAGCDADAAAAPFSASRGTRGARRRSRSRSATTKIPSTTSERPRSIPGAVSRIS